LNVSSKISIQKKSSIRYEGNNMIDVHKSNEFVDVNKDINVNNIK